MLGNLLARFGALPLFAKKIILVLVALGVAVFASPLVAASVALIVAVVALLVGLVWLITAGTVTALWVVLLRLDQGTPFGLALTFSSHCVPDSEHAAALSGMVQSVTTCWRRSVRSSSASSATSHTWAVALALLCWGSRCAS